MEIKGKVCIVTGGASGIGEGICKRYVEEGAKAVVVVDYNEEGAKRVADEIGGVAMGCDVSVEAQIIDVVQKTEEQFGQVDVMFSNAGIYIGDPNGPATASNEDWQKIWEVNVMAHIYAARAVLPGMLERGDGYILSTASAAGLLSQVGTAPYSVTKAAAVSYAETLAIGHGDDGIKVSVLCPQAVRSGMTGNSDGGVAGRDGMKEPSDAAEEVIQAMRDEKFLILTHHEVATYRQRKADDYDRWLNGMRRYRRSFMKD